MIKIAYVQYLLDNRGTAAAEKVIADIAQKEPQEEGYRLALAHVLYLGGKDDQAEAILKAIVDKESKGTAALLARIRLANDAFSDGRYDQARSLIEEVLAIDGTEEDALLLRAEFFVKDKNYSAAIKDVRAVLQQHPQSRAGLLELARAYQGSDDAQLVLESYKDYLDVYPEDDEIRTEYAKALYSHGHRADAERELQAITDHAPNFILAQVAKIEILLDQSHLPEAEDIARGIVENAAPRDLQRQAVGHSYLGMALAMQGHFDSASAQFKQALAILPDAEEVQELLVRSYLFAGHGVDALDFLNGEIARRPKSVQPLVLLAQTQAKLGKRDEAESTLKRCTAVGSGSSVCYAELGSFYSQDGKPVLAADAYRAGLEKIPAQIDLMRGLASAEERLNHHEAAREVYRAILAKIPDDLFASNNLAALIADVWPKDKEQLRQAQLLARDFRLRSDPMLLDTLGWVQYRLGEIDDALLRSPDSLPSWNGASGQGRQCGRGDRASEGGCHERTLSRPRRGKTGPCDPMISLQCTFFYANARFSRLWWLQP
jgi:predicted Zn-dependent protease